MLRPARSSSVAPMNRNICGLAYTIRQSPGSTRQASSPPRSSKACKPSCGGLVESCIALDFLEFAHLECKRPHRPLDPPMFRQSPLYHTGESSGNLAGITDRLELARRHRVGRRVENHENQAT